MAEMKRRSAEEILGKPIIHLSAGESAEIDIRINDEMSIVIRESNYRLGDILPPINGCGLLGLSWNDIFNP